MRKLGIIIIILLFISPEYLHNKSHELDSMAKIVNANNLITKEWIVTIKEKVSQAQVMQHLTKLKENNQIKYTENKNIIKYQIDEIRENEEIYISYEITVPQNKNYTPELVVNIKGTNISQQLDKSRIILQHIRKQFFTEKADQFTCLIALKDDMIQSDDFFNKMSKDLNLKYTSTQSDVINGISQQEILYGYTTLWNNEIIMKNDLLNIQIVLQDLNDERQKVIIGTPIIITEY